MPVAASTAGPTCSFSGIVTFNGAPEVREAAAMHAARPPARGDRQPVPGTRPPPRQAQPARLGAVRRGPPGRRARRRRRRDPRRDATQRGTGVRPRLTSRLRSGRAVPGLFRPSRGPAPETGPQDRERPLKFDDRDRRRLVYASALTIVALPAVWLVNREDDGSVRPNVAAVGPAVGDVTESTTPATIDPMGDVSPQFLGAADAVTAEPTGPVLPVIGTEDGAVLATGTAIFRRSRHRPQARASSVVSRAAATSSSSTSPTTGPPMLDGTAPDRRAAGRDGDERGGVRDDRRPDRRRRSTSRSGSRDALAPCGARAADEPRPRPAPRASGRTSSPIRTPSGASPTSPASARATTSSRSAPGSAR